MANKFQSKLSDSNLNLKKSTIDTVQVNVGRKCNQACRHCHVDAGPKRKEMISQEVVNRIFELIDTTPTITTLDITGGAPEISEYFCQLVLEGRRRNLHVIDRCNLTILSEPGYENLSQFLASNSVHIIASLPCYSESNVDKQRGDGVFERSISGLRELNSLGYGSGNLTLDLVYNPLGASLPGNQAALEKAYKEQLKEKFGIVFNNLYTITNIPILRFRAQLRSEGKLEAYENLLEGAFNTNTVDKLMCKNICSVSYEGKLFDCDFNQMIDLGEKRDVWSVNSFSELSNLDIATDIHCFGCTAGGGSSCGGSLE